MQFLYTIVHTDAISCKYYFKILMIFEAKEFLQKYLNILYKKNKTRENFLSWYIIINY